MDINTSAKHHITVNNRMYSMTMFLVLALLATAVLAKENVPFGSQDYDLLESTGQTAMVQHSQLLSSSTAPSNESVKTLLPEFVTVLFKCWARREDNARYRECLESMGEGEKAAEIMGADSVTAFIGVCKLYMSSCMQYIVV